MKKLNLILLIMLISYGIINSTLSKADLIKKENRSVNNSEIIMMPVHPEDINSDGVVDIDDFALCLMDEANFCTGDDCVGDFSGDGITDVTDVIQIYNDICSHLNQ